MEDTWETRELPVLEAVIKYLEEHAGHLVPQVIDIAEITSIDPMDVYRAVLALDPTFLELRPVGGPSDHIIFRVTDRARVAVGQWPSPETVADRIVQALLDAAEREPDEQQRSKLRQAAQALGGFGKDLLVSVLANVATKPIPF